MRTLSQDFVVIMSQCTTPTFSPYFCLAHIFKQACVMWRRKCKIQGNLCPFFFLVLDLVIFGPGVAVWTRVADPKFSSAIFFLLSPPQPLHHVDGTYEWYDGLHISTQNYTLQHPWVHISDFQCKQVCLYQNCTYCSAPLNKMAARPLDKKYLSTAFPP